MQQPEDRVLIIEPPLGADYGQAPQELDPGYTPASQNFIRDSGYITPRSGLSRYDATYSLGDAALYGTDAYDVTGFRYGLAASRSTVGMLGPNATKWSNLSYTGADGIDANSATGWDADFIYEPTRDKNVAVLTENQHLPKYVVLDSSTTLFSDFTYCASAFSKARSVCAFDNRLVWFNTSSTVSSFPQRVEYSARGTPTDYTTANGAGFVDLMDMRGVGQMVVAEQDGILLFSDVEIWRGRKRGDDYVFDFYPVSKTMGCPYPKTIAQTPDGVCFLGWDMEVYLLNGTDLIPMGPTRRKSPEQGDPSRVQKYLQDNIINGQVAWAVWNTRARRYELYFAKTGMFPRAALYLDFNNMSWFEQKFDMDELSFGFDMQDTAAAVTWDSISLTWNQYNVPWNTGNMAVPDRAVVAFSSNGTPYRFVSTQTSDDGTTIDARWRSHAFNQADQFRYDELYEVWFEYLNPSASSASVWVSETLGASFYTDPVGLSLSATSIANIMAPVWITATSPLFEVRVNDGGQPKFSRLQARLRDSGQWSGAL